MSLKKLLLSTAALALVTVIQVETAASSTCPPPRHFSGACIDVVVWATDPATGTCCQYPNPCSAPQGWTISYTGCAAAS